MAGKAARYLSGTHKNGPVAADFCVCSWDFVDPSHTNRESTQDSSRIGRLTRCHGCLMFGTVR
jgi:hypothetical protein